MVAPSVLTSHTSVALPFVMSAAYADVVTRRNHVYVDTFNPLLHHEQWRNDLAANDGRPGQSGYGLMAWLVLHRGWYNWLNIPEHG